jgi:hypothetical protein
MRTSLNIEDRLMEAAKREAEKNKQTISETITRWARYGYEALRKQNRQKVPRLRTVDLGGPAKVDLNSRRDWLDQLDE